MKPRVGGTRWARRWTVVAASVTAVPLLYLFSVPVVFDLSRSAQSINEEYHNGKPVAFGPCPRLLFADGANLDIPGGLDFYGDEPVLWIYRPVCDVWRWARGYEARSVSRR